MTVLCLSKVTCRDRSPPPTNSAEIVLERSIVSSEDSALTRRMFSRGNLKGLRIHAAYSVEHHQCASERRHATAASRQAVVDPYKERRIFELMLHRQIEIESGTTISAFGRLAAAKPRRELSAAWTWQCAGNELEAAGALRGRIFCGSADCVSFRHWGPQRMPATLSALTRQSWRNHQQLRLDSRRSAAEQQYRAQYEIPDRRLANCVYEILLRLSISAAECALEPACRPAACACR